MLKYYCLLMLAGTGLVLNDSHAAPAWLNALSSVGTTDRVKYGDGLHSEAPNILEASERIPLVDLVSQHADIDTDFLGHEVSMYENFAIVEEGESISLEYQDGKLKRILFAKSKYDRLRIDFQPVLSVVKDCFPLDSKLMKLSLKKTDLWNPDRDLQKILQEDENFLSRIDNLFDLTKEMTGDDSIEVLIHGKYKEDELQTLQNILAINVEHSGSSHMLYRYPNDETRPWFDEQLDALDFPFLQSPIDHIAITSNYDTDRGHKKHRAIDFAAPTGTPIRAAASGVVKKAGWQSGYGLTVQVSHPTLGKIETLYAHMSKSKVKKGERIQQGQVIGLVGSTGRSTGPHLHYEIRRNGAKSNPFGQNLRRLFRPNLPESNHLGDYSSLVGEVFKTDMPSPIEVPEELNEILLSNL
jgi:murein DD-endopeptidase MepM/ murein hydrolase activator NlpD